VAPLALANRGDERNSLCGIGINLGEETIEVLERVREKETLCCVDLVGVPADPVAIAPQ